PYQSLYFFLYPLLLSIGLNLAMTALYLTIVPKFRTILDQLRLDSTGHMIWWPRLMLANEAVLLLCVAMVVILVMGGTSIYFGSSIFRWMKGGLDRVLLALP